MDNSETKISKVIESLLGTCRTLYNSGKDVNHKDNPPERKSSNRLHKAIVYLVNNESRLRTFLDNPYGVMTNNVTEEKFMELDLLRNGMMASDTCKGAANLT